MEETITTTQQLEKKLDEIKNMLIELNLIKMDIKLLIDKDQIYYETTSRSRFFYRLHINYIRLLVIDSYKLLAQKEHFNYSTLISFCKINRKSIIWDRELPLLKLNELEKDYKQVYSQYYYDIYILRNKFFAHNDKNKDKFREETKLYLIKLWEVLDVLNMIFTKINSYLKNEDCRLLFSEAYLPKSREIEEAHKYNELRKLFFKSFRGEKKDLDLEEVRKIILG